MGRKLEVFTKEDHIEMAEDVRVCFKLLEKWQEKVWKSWGVKHKASRRLDRAIRAVRLDLRDVMDDGWYHSSGCEGRSPYYNPEYKVEHKEQHE